MEQVERALDNTGAQILVSYTPPGTTTAIVQNGTITPFEGRSVMTFAAPISTFAPWALVKSWVNTVNSAAFNPYGSGAGPREWLITDMNYELVAKPAGFPTYDFTMTMRHNPDKWDPFVIYIDPETGRPPAPDADGNGGLVAGQGYKTIPWHIESNFDQLFI